MVNRLRPAANLWRAGHTGTWRPVPSATTGFLLAGPMIVMVLLLVAYPLVQLVQSSLMVTSRYDGGLANYVAFFDSGANVRALLTTLRVSLLVTVISLALGSLVAWYLRSTTSTLGRLIVWTSILAPLWMGVVVKNYSITLILAPIGLVNVILQWLGILAQPVSFLNTVPAVVVGMVYTMMPWATLPLFGVFRAIDLDLIRAAESLGARRTSATLSIVFPLALPGILSAFAIVFVISIGFFITPVLLGGLTSPFTASLIATELFTYFNVVSAAVSGVMLIVVALIVLIIAWRLVGAERLSRALAR